MNKAQLLLEHTKLVRSLHALESDAAKNGLKEIRRKTLINFAECRLDEIIEILYK